MQRGVADRRGRLRAPNGIAVDIRVPDARPARQADHRQLLHQGSDFAHAAKDPGDNGASKENPQRCFPLR